MRIAVGAYVHPILTKDFNHGRPLYSQCIAAPVWWAWRRLLIVVEIAQNAFKPSGMINVPV